MTNPLINILIRTHRPSLQAALYSIDYHPSRTIIHEGLANNFDYNLFCNDLKARVRGGWFMFLDDDDTLIPGALAAIAPHLIDRPVVCQMLRAGVQKPTLRQMIKGEIRKGHIGMPCIFVPYRLKDAAHFDNTEFADYHYIRDINEIERVKFVNIPVVNSPQRNYGKNPV